MPIEIRTPETAARPVWRSLGRGARGRCPNCGEGALIRGYLTPADSCAVCGEELHHQRSDDFGPYLTMVIVGHLMVPLLATLMLATVLSPWLVLAIALPSTALLAFALLRPVKGGIIALQWALRMHGFNGSADPDAPEAVVPLLAPPAVAVQPLAKTGLATK